MAGLLDDPKPQKANPVVGALNAMGAGLTAPGGSSDPVNTPQMAPDLAPVASASPQPHPTPLPPPPPNPSPAPSPVPAPSPTAPDNRNVEERLNGLLDANSDYIKRARNEGMMVANRRGLQNSSIAAGAAQGAAIDRALPAAAGRHAGDDVGAVGDGAAHVVRALCPNALDHQAGVCVNEHGHVAKFQAYDFRFPVRRAAQ